MDKTEIISRIVTVRGLGFPNSNPDPDPISESTKTLAARGLEEQNF